MLCRGKDKGVFTVIGIMGIISIVFGLMMKYNIPESSHDAQMAAGFLSGIGTAFTAIFLIRKIQEKFFPDKVKKDTIEMNDERNQEIKRSAASIAWLVSMIWSAGAAFILLMMNQRIGAYAAVGGIYVSGIACLIAMRVFGKKM